MIGFSFDFRSLRARLVLALLAILVLTALSIGLPILWLVNSQPLHRVIISEIQVWQAVLGGAALVALIAVVVGLFLARRIAAPLERLTAASESIGRGDLGTPVSAWDDVTELAVLAGTLESMRRRLRSAYDDLARSKEWSDNLIASLVEGVFTLDADGTLTSFSPGAERILGWRATDVVGRPADAVFQAAPVRNSPPGTIIRQAVTTRQGARILLLITTGAVTRASAGTTEQAFVFRDVTQEEESLRLREFFLANVSHELKTPLSSLRASIELLASEQDSLTGAERSELISSLWLGTIRLE
ncbi:MAG: HAMP domain-containing protein, partial [Rudaea sp.]